jgi:dipeptidyl aminopeptidase/acylaminoacyl peptidase
LLPRESHAYRARESVLHVLWEQDQWLERHVRQRPDG